MILAGSLGSGLSSPLIDRPKSMELIAGATVDGVNRASVFLPLCGLSGLTPGCTFAET
jgi:hypothetical protein